MPTYFVYKAVLIDAPANQSPEWWVVDSREADQREGKLVVFHSNSEEEARQEAARLNAG